MPTYNQISNLLFSCWKYGGKAHFNNAINYSTITLKESEDCIENLGNCLSRQYLDMFDLGHKVTKCEGRCTVYIRYVNCSQVEWDSILEEISKHNTKKFKDTILSMKKPGEILKRSFRELRFEDGRLLSPRMEEGILKKDWYALLSEFPPFTIEANRLVEVSRYCMELGFRVYVHDNVVYIPEFIGRDDALTFEFMCDPTKDKNAFSERFSFYEPGELAITKEMVSGSDVDYISEIQEMIGKRFLDQLGSFQKAGGEVESREGSVLRLRSSVNTMIEYLPELEDEDGQINRVKYAKDPEIITVDIKRPDFLERKFWKIALNANK